MYLRKNRIHTCHLQSMKTNKIISLGLLILLSIFEANSIEIPKQFQKESIIITEQNIEIEYEASMKRKRGKHLFKTLEKTDFTFLLNDKLAVESFSEYYIPKNAEVSIKIIKPDDKEVEVDMSEAVTISSSVEIPVFKRLFSITEESKKIAIPDLEVGDRINFIVEKENSEIYTWVAQYTFAFNDIYLQRNAPILKQNIKIKYGENIYLNYKVFNSETVSPEIDEEERTLTITQENLFGMKDERYVYKDRVYPSIKYEAIYVNALRKKRTDLNANKTGETFEGLNTEFLKIKAYKDFYNFEKRANKILNPFMNRKGRANGEKFIKYFYEDLSWNEKEEDLDIEQKEFFIALLGHALSKKKIPFEYGYSKPRFKGDIHTAISTKEFEPFILAKIQGEEYYLFTPGKYNFWDSYKSDFDGCEAFYIKLHKSFEKVQIRNDFMPIKDYDDNILTYTYEVQISDSLKSMRIIQRQNSTGFFKESRKSEIVSFQEMTKEYLDLEYEIGPLAGTPLFQNTLKLVSSISNKVREEAFKERYNNLEYLSFSILEEGKESVQEPLEFEDVYTVVGLPFRMNEGVYGCRLSSIMLPQNYIDPADSKKERELPIFLPAQRQVNYVLNLKLPKNAIIENIDAFNFEMKKSFIEYKSVVKENKDGKYTINISVNYKELELPPERWLEYVETINAFYDFTLTRLIITNKSGS